MFNKTSLFSKDSSSEPKLATLWVSTPWLSIIVFSVIFLLCIQITLFITQDNLFLTNFSETQLNWFFVKGEFLLVIHAILGFLLFAMLLVILSKFSTQEVNDEYLPFHKIIILKRSYIFTLWIADIIFLFPLILGFTNILNIIPTVLIAIFTIRSLHILLIHLTNPLTIDDEVYDLRFSDLIQTLVQVNNFNEEASQKRLDAHLSYIKSLMQEQIVQNNISPKTVQMYEYATKISSEFNSQTSNLFISIATSNHLSKESIYKLIDMIETHAMNARNQQNEDAFINYVNSLLIIKNNINKEGCNGDTNLSQNTRIVTAELKSCFARIISGLIDNKFGNSPSIKAHLLTISEHFLVESMHLDMPLDFVHIYNLSEQYFFTTTNEGMETVKFATAFSSFIGSLNDQFNELIEYSFYHQKQWHDIYYKYIFPFTSTKLEENDKSITNKAYPKRKAKTQNKDNKTIDIKVTASSTNAVLDNKNYNVATTSHLHSSNKGNDENDEIDSETTYDLSEIGNNLSQTNNETHIINKNNTDSSLHTSSSAPSPPKRSKSKHQLMTNTMPRKAVIINQQSLPF